MLGNAISLIFIVWNLPVLKLSPLFTHIELLYMLNIQVILLKVTFINISYYNCRCVVCWQAFAHSTALKLHTRRHTGERPFKCVECNAGFTQLPHWKKHMRCIHGRNEPYGCKYCKNFFRIKSDLEVHEKSCLEASSKDESNAESNALKNSKFSGMSIEKMRLLLAVLLKRISKPERLEELGFGKRLIDEILEDSLVAAGKDPIKSDDPTEEHETLRSNLEMFLEWTVPQEHWKTFMKKKKTPEQILETLTAT